MMAAHDKNYSSKQEYFQLSPVNQVQGNVPGSFLQYCTLYLKNVPSLTGYSFNIHAPIFIIFGTSSADFQKSAAGITFSITSLLLTLFCFEEK